MIYESVEYAQPAIGLKNIAGAWDTFWDMTEIAHGTIQHLNMRKGHIRKEVLSSL